MKESVRKYICCRACGRWHEYYTRVCVCVCVCMCNVVIYTVLSQLPHSKCFKYFLFVSSLMLSMSSTYEFIMRHEYSKLTCQCYTHECVMSHVWMRHTMLHTWMRHVTRVNASCHTYERVMSHMWMRRAYNKFTCRCWWDSRDLPMRARPPGSYTHTQMYECVYTYIYEDIFMCEWLAGACSPTYIIHTHTQTQT